MTHDEQRALVRRMERTARAPGGLWIAAESVAALLDIIYQLQGEKDRAEWVRDHHCGYEYLEGVAVAQACTCGDPRHTWDYAAWTAEAKRKWLED